MWIPPASPRDLDRFPGRPPLLRVAAAEDAPARAAEQRDALRAAVLEHGAVLVRNHNEEIGEGVVALFNQVYEALTAREPWQAGDLMLVDDVRTAHSREAHEGPREVLVGLADPVRVSASSPSDGATAR